MRCVFAFLVALTPGPAWAQVVSRPAEPPIVTAENDDWYRRGEPVLVAGEAYYPAGAAVFFNGNVMVRTGHYSGVPVYSDTTLEPYSVLFVPIGRGLMQPYERRRQGDLAGTAGSRTPSFPVSRVPEPVAEAGPGLPAEAAAPPVAVSGGEPGAVGTTGRTGSQAVAGTTGSVRARSQAQGAVGVATARRAETNDGIWLQFMGERWVISGSPVPLRASEFVVVGSHAGFPVYARKGLDEDRIYLPAPGGLVPFRLKN